MVSNFRAEEGKRNFDQEEKGNYTDVDRLVFKVPHDKEGGWVVDHNASSVHHGVGSEAVSRSSDAPNHSV